LWDSTIGRLSHDPGAAGSSWLGQLVVPALGDVISMMLYSVACLHSLQPDFVGWAYIKRATAVAEWFTIRFRDVETITLYLPSR
jgi:hypothetical protein